MTVVNYQELQKQCSEFNTALNHYQMEGRRVILKVREYFAKYLEAPDQKIRLLGVDPNNTENKYRKDFLPIFGENSGEWRFGLGITNNHDGQCIISFFDFCLRFQENGVILSHVDALVHREFSYKFDEDASALNPVYEYMTEVLAKNFERRPWDSMNKIPIGFQRA
jgi:hypothetical protein